MIDIVTPPVALLPQFTQQKQGRVPYKDTDGHNLQDGYFFADNSDIAIPNKKLRPIQLGRGYNFTGVETIEFPFGLIKQNVSHTFKFTVKPSTSGISQILYSNNDVEGSIASEIFQIIFMK